MEKIQVKFYLPDYSKSIEIQIIQTQETSKENYIVVGGQDTTWVNGIIMRLSQVLDSCEKQPGYRDWLWLFSTVSCLGCMVLVFHAFIANKQTEQMPPILGLLVVFGWLLGLPLFFRHLHKHLAELWPAVELQTGYQYLQIPANKRIKAFVVVTGIVLPLIVAAIYDLIKVALGY